MPGSAMLSEQAWGEIARSLCLSPRELQILQAVFDDRTEYCIAADLGISPHTVHTHFNRLHRKLAEADRVGLLVRVMDEFLTLTAAPDSTLPSICAARAAGRCLLLKRRSP
jgi:DNA-binding NarL/FixJ family response regulator